mgnify:CR=1 FL=1
MIDWTKLELTKSTIEFVRTELSEKEFLELEDVEKKFSSPEEKKSHLFYILISKEYAADENEQVEEFTVNTLHSISKNGTEWTHKYYDVYIDEKIKTPFLKFDIDKDFDYNQVYKKILLHKRLWRYL